MNQMDGKVCVVTGSTQGLGAAIARTFADRGAAGLVICGRSQEKGEATAKEIKAATGAKVVFVAADLGKVEDCRAVIAAGDEGSAGIVERRVGPAMHAPGSTGPGR